MAKSNPINKQIQRCVCASSGHSYQQYHLDDDPSVVLFCVLCGDILRESCTLDSQVAAGIIEATARGNA